MKVALLALFFAASTFAQNAADPATTSCGPAGAQVHVHLDKHPPAPQPPEPGKARVYFIQQSGMKFNLEYPSIKVAVDGAWVGALRPNSYFAASVAPGEHHLCASLHSVALGAATELADFSAEPGRSYFYRSRLIFTRGQVYLELQPVDSDEARHLMASDPVSVASPR